MANNRLYLRCKHCGGTVFLAKHFGGALETIEGTDERLNDFFERHLYCSNYNSYYLELCEEFPGEMTDNNVDCNGDVIWFK